MDFIHVSFTEKIFPHRVKWSGNTHNQFSFYVEQIAMPSGWKRAPCVCALCRHFALRNPCMGPRMGPHKPLGNINIYMYTYTYTYTYIHISCMYIYTHTTLSNKSHTDIVWHTYKPTHFTYFLARLRSWIPQLRLFCSANWPAYMYLFPACVGVLICWTLKGNSLNIEGQNGKHKWNIVHAAYGTCRK